VALRGEGLPDGGYRQFRNLRQKVKQTERWLARHRCAVEA
jgi:hypothetical protein